jgi:hypothetical protein
MRTTSLFALAALAASPLVACVAENANDTRNVDLQKDGVTPLGVIDAGTDSGTGNSGNGPVDSFKTTSDVAVASSFGWELQYFLRAGKGSDGKVHVDFNMSSVDPTSWSCFTPPWWDPSWPPPPMFCAYTRRTFTYAYGTVPNGSYRSVQGYAQLTANLVNGPTLVVSSCTWDDATYTSTCATDPGGAVDVLWRANGWFSSTQTGSREQQFGALKLRTSGSLKTQGADVTGSVFGLSVDGSFGEIVRSTGAAIQFDAYLLP